MGPILDFHFCDAVYAIRIPTVRVYDTRIFLKKTGSAPILGRLIRSHSGCSGIWLRTEVSYANAVWSVCKIHPLP